MRPAVILSIQTYGRTCNYHPHLHLLVSDGSFDSQGTFYPLPYVDTLTAGFLRSINMLASTIYPQFNDDW